MTSFSENVTMLSKPELRTTDGTNSGEHLSTRTPFDTIKSIRPEVCVVIGLGASRFALRLARRTNRSALYPVLIAVDEERAAAGGISRAAAAEGSPESKARQPQDDKQDGLEVLTPEAFRGGSWTGHAKGGVLRVRCKPSCTTELIESLSVSVGLILLLDPGSFSDIEKATSVAFSKLSEKGALVVVRSSEGDDDRTLAALNSIPRDWQGQVLTKREYYLLPTPAALPVLRRNAKVMQWVRTRELVVPYKFLDGTQKEIHNARIFGSDWDAFVPGAGVIWNPISHKRWFNRRLSRTHCVLTYSSSAQPRRLSQPVVIIGGFHNFYHHLVDYMSRMFTIENIGPDWYYALYEDRSAFHSQTRRFFEIPEERTLFFPRDGIPVRCDRAILAPPAVVKKGKVVNVAAINKMRAFAVAKSGTPKEKINILISRRNAKKRRIENEDELYEGLSKRGFLNVALESLSFADQVKLFASAKTIVAPHGAGLANIIFASPGAEIVELSPSQGAPDYFMNLAKGCGHRFTRLPGLPSVDDSHFAVDAKLVLNTLRG